MQSMQVFPTNLLPVSKRDGMIIIGNPGNNISQVRKSLDLKCKLS